MIELKKVFRALKYMGSIGIEAVDMTPQKIANIKADKEDKMGWAEYVDVLEEHGIDIRRYDISPE